MHASTVSPSLMQGLCFHHAQGPYGVAVYLPRRGPASGCAQVHITSSAARAINSRPLREAPLEKAIVISQRS